MKTIVNYTLIESPVLHLKLKEGLFFTREYASRSEAFIPVRGEKIKIQCGFAPSQSTYFIVTSVENALWTDKDCIEVCVRYDH